MLDGLANRYHQPLGHSSIKGLFVALHLTTASAPCLPYKDRNSRVAPY